MHLAALAAGLVSVHTTSAFLIPPSTSLSDLQITQVKTATNSPSIFGADLPWEVELACPGCPWAGVEDINGTQTQWSRDFETSLVSAFNSESGPVARSRDHITLTTLQLISVSASSANGLLLNNVATLLSPSSAPVPAALYATQKLTSTGATSLPFPIDFILERLEPITSHNDRHRVLLPVRFTIVGFAGHAVHVDTLAIDLLASDGGRELGVVRVQKVPFGTTPGAASCPDDEVWSLCRVRAIIQHRVLETMRAMRAKAAAAKGWVRGGCHRGLAHGMQRAQYRDHNGPEGHRHHGGRHMAHRYATMLHSALRFFVIPALLGVIGGLLASAVGMLVGQFIVFVWLRVVRRGRRKPFRREVVVVDENGEKCGLLEADSVVVVDGDDEEALPRYSMGDSGEVKPPAYRDEAGEEETS
jgi:hypothetical protein